VPKLADQGRDKPKYKAQSAEKLLEILNSFLLGPQGQTVAGVAAATGISRPTASRLLSTLEAQEYVVRVDGKYRLGHKCILLGSAAVGSLDLQEQARPIMRSLCAATKESVQLGVLSDWKLVYVEQVSAPRSVAYMTSRVGSILPAYCTGLGKALLAYEPKEKLEGWASVTSFDGYTPTTLTNAAALLEDLAQIRGRGYAIDNAEREPEVRCVAAPVCNSVGEVIAAVSVAGPSERLPADLAGSDLAKQVVAAATSISLRLGCPPGLWKAGVSWPL
jgi:DNA-binding IclR family transcriptional regulator